MYARPVPFSALTQPLLARFGAGLTLARDGDGVRWNYAGSSVVVEQVSNGTVAANFVSRPVATGPSAEAVRAVYRPQPSAYPLTESGVARMVDDLTEFFLGTREPRFTFVDAFVEEFPH